MASCTPQLPVVWRSSILQPKRKSSVSGKIARDKVKIILGGFKYEKRRVCFALLEIIDSYYRSRETVDL